MSDQEQANCGQCVHYLQINSSGCCYAAARLETPPAIEAPEAGPHDCEAFEPSDAHRLALALEDLVYWKTVELGVLEAPSAEERTQRLVCKCKSYFDVNSTDTAARCPVCRQAFTGDGEGGWRQAVADEGGE